MRQPIPFGKYLLLERISVGGMAEVFKAKSYGVEGFEKVIAIKRILPTMVEDAEFIQMFIDEAKIAGQLSHANICQIFELGKIAESHFIAMEFIWGKDLLQIQNRFRKQRLVMPPTMAAFCAAKMCEGLDYAHKKKDARGVPLQIVHRDVSPQNVLVSYEGEVKLIDFGIAKAATRSSKTQAGVLKGKFGYMSPEQVRGQTLDRRSDIFALGTIVYELLTGERLFLGESDFSTLEKVRNVDIPPLHRVNPKVPPALEKIVMRALAREPETRYAWASELQEELVQFLMSQQPVFTAKQLAGWMKEAFSVEMTRERQLLEQYKKVGRDGIIGGKAAADNKVTVDEGLGAPAAPDDGAESTTLGGPDFGDVLDEALAAAEDSVMGVAPGAPHDETRAGGPLGKRTRTPGAAAGGDSFGDEQPTEIFGEVESRAGTDAPLPSESTVILPNGSGSAVPSPVPPPPPVASPRAPTAPGGASNTPAPRPSRGMPGATPSPVSGLGGGVPMPLVAAPSMPAMAPPGVGMPLGGMGGLPMGASMGTPSGATPAMAFPPPVGSFAPGVSASAAASAMRDHTSLTEAVPKMPPLASPRRRLARDIGLAVGIAVLALGLVVGGRVLFGGKKSVAVPAPTGTIVVAAVDSGGGVVLLNGKPQGHVAAGAEPLRIDSLPGGDYEIVMRRAGSPDCTKKVSLDVARPEVVTCSFTAVAPAPGELRLRVKTPDVTVLVDNQEISAEAAAAPLQLAPAVDHSITVQREGYITQSLQVRLGAGEVQERDVELTPIDGKGGGKDPVAVIKGAPKEPPADPPPVVRDPRTPPRDPIAVKDPPRDPIAVKDPPKDPKPPKGPGAGLFDDDKPKDPKKPPPDPKTSPKDPPKEPVKDSGGGAGGDAPAGDVGYLIANTTPYARVLIDNKDTGKMTPIAPRAKVPIKAGKHVVTFVVGEEKFNYPINIEAGRDHRLIKTLPVE